ncbi:trafficking protein particle complex subunit 8 isoform X2 [Ischnura elegans]|uniref:trafficking protein particle complex subunit 8 isoform X2 n=1 Tax=Ischnura elegans TaxID=197161 RepID=UPI001ED86D40|nr:trafficking protein particle complex subunit 8 isoform X2 [Ischnura elegans]
MKESPQEFIQKTFSPMIAVISSSSAENICQKSNLSFIDLLRPYCKLSCEAQMRDPSGAVVPVRGLRLTLRSVDHVPPPPAVGRRMLDDAVSSTPPNLPSTLQNIMDPSGTILSEDVLSEDTRLPWFELWREVFLQVQPVFEHEFIKHYVACFLVVSSSEGDVSSVERLNSLWKEVQKLSSKTSGGGPKWFFPNAILKYCIILHDQSTDDLQKAEAAFSEVKSVFGLGCYLLRINSREAEENAKESGTEEGEMVDHWVQYLPTQSLNTPEEEIHEPSSHNTLSQKGLNADVGEEASPEMDRDDTDTASVSVSYVVQDHPLSPDSDKVTSNIMSISDSEMNVSMTMSGSKPPLVNSEKMVKHGMQLLNEDLERIQSMVNDFCTRLFIPHAERQMQILHEAISNRKGMSRSIFSATKRWFGGNRPGLQGPPVPSITYASDSPELQLRRLADLCFLFGHYAMASEAYRSAKRDFAADGAWTHFAGALEMAGLAAFLHWNSPGPSPAGPVGTSTSGVGALGSVVGGGSSSTEAARKAIEYLDQSVLTYLNTCRMYNLATRATLMASEVLLTPWAGNKHGDAAASLVRLAGEDSDLRSALLLERASLCLLSHGLVHHSSSKLKSSVANAINNIQPVSPNSDASQPVVPNNLTLALSASSKALPRKAALHAVLAGHRYSKAGHRPHALRCYAQAYKVYEGKGWRLAEDHIHFAMGRLASHLKRPQNAAHSFSLLLSPSLSPPFYAMALTPSPTSNQPSLPPASGPTLIPTRNQPPVQQAIYLKEFLNAQLQLKMMESEESGKQSLPVLPIPTIEQGSIKVLLGSSSSRSDGPKKNGASPQFASGVGFNSNHDEDGSIGWAKLEENLLLAAQGSVPMVFIPTVQMYSDRSDNSTSPIGVMGEPVLVQIKLCNPLSIPLPLSDIRLLWTHTPLPDQKSGSNIPSGNLVNDCGLETSSSREDGEGVVARTQSVSSLVLAPVSNQEVVLSLTPLCMGELRIQGIAFSLSNPTPGVPEASTKLNQNPVNGSLTVEGMLPFNIKRSFTKSSKSDSQKEVVDRRLHINVCRPMPLLQVVFKELPTELVGGEIRRTEVEICNIGLRSLSLKSLYVATPSPNSFCFGFAAPHIEEGGDTKAGDTVIAKWRNVPPGDGLTKDRCLPPGVWRLGVNSIAKRASGETLDKDGLLGPGQGLVLPMWVRGPEGQGEKSVSLSLLFYYEAADDLHVETSGVQKGSFQRGQRRPCHRLIRHSWKVDMLDAVELRGRGGGSIGEVLPGCGSSPQSLNLTLNLKNCSPSNLRPGVGMVSEVRLLRASLASLHWTLAPTRPILPLEVKLGAQESINLLFKAHRSSNEDSREDEILFSDVVLDSSESPEVQLDPHVQHWALPAMPFSYLSKIGEESRSGKNMNEMGDDDKGGKSESDANASSEPPMPTRLDATLILRWRAMVKWNTISDGAEAMVKEHWVYGQHQVSIDALSLTPGSNQSVLGGSMPWSQSTLHTLPSLVSQLSPLEILQRLVTHTIYHPPQVTHDFSCSRLCLVPVKLLLQNCSSYHLTVEVQTSSIGGYPGNKNQMYSPHPSGQFLWVGRVSAIVNLQPHAPSQDPITLTAAFPAPGTYNLASRLSVSCRQCVDRKEKSVTQVSSDKPQTALESEKVPMEGSVDFGSLDLRTHLGKEAVTQVWRVESAVVVIGA